MMNFKSGLVIIAGVVLVLGLQTLQMQLGYSQPVSATTNTNTTTNTTTTDSSNISTPTGFFDRTGECLVIEDADERNECFDQIIEDKEASGDK